MARVPCCVWRISDDLVTALDARFGEPVDAYVNGSQVWLREDGPAGETIEWRLHPVAGFRRPPGAGTHELFESVALAVATGGEPVAAPASLWDGLEAFPPYDDDGGAELEPARLAAACAAALGLAPDAAGLVDHVPVGDAWERSNGAFAIVGALLEQLESTLDGDA